MIQRRFISETELRMNTQLMRVRGGLLRRGRLVKRLLRSPSSKLMRTPLIMVDTWRTGETPPSALPGDQGLKKVPLVVVVQLDRSGLEELSQDKLEGIKIPSMNRQLLLTPLPWRLPWPLLGCCWATLPGGWWRGRPPWLPTSWPCTRWSNGFRKKNSHFFFSGFHLQVWGSLWGCC